MRALIQRVRRACVRFDGVERGVGRGVLVLLGVGAADDGGTAAHLAEKCAALRIFPDPAGKFGRSLLDVRGEALVVSQFTLYGDCRRGRRPDFTAARRPEEAEPLYRLFAESLAALGVPTKTGEFGASMEVELVNDGPVTLWLDTADP